MPSRLLPWSPLFFPSSRARAGVVSSVSQSRQRRREPRARPPSPAWLLGVMLVSATAHAVAPNAVPEGPTLRQGGAAIARDASGLQIIQMGDHAIIDWRSFDIGRRAAVHVMQASPEATLLNRVTGATASEIAGNLTASGRVFLINPNGIGFTSTSTVAAAAFVASTLNIADRDFMAGTWHFGDTARPGRGAIAHAGEIDINAGGFALLLGHRIAHSGTIRTPQGYTALVADAPVTLMPNAHAFLRVMRSARPAANLSGDEPAAVHSYGIIEAHGGLVLASPATYAAPGQASNAAWGSRGPAGARQVIAQPGMILIEANAGTARLSGVLDASSGIAGDGREPGGTVNILGTRVVMEGPTIDVCGARDGGRVQIVSGVIEGMETIHWFRPTQVTVVGSGPSHTFSTVPPLSPLSLPSPPSPPLLLSPLSPPSPPLLLSPPLPLSPLSSASSLASPSPLSPRSPVLRPSAPPPSPSPFALPSAALPQPVAPPLSPAFLAPPAPIGAGRPLSAAFPSTIRIPT